MRERLRLFAAEFGIADLRIPARSPNTRRALAVAEFARDEGKLERFRVLAMDAHWQRGLDLEKEEDLRRIAEESGLDPGKAASASTNPSYLQRVDLRRLEAASRGVTGIPTFVIADRGVVGCQPYEVLAEFVRSSGGERRAGGESPRS
jgi:predicted DsbA family dithiol-disulfide isomerase